VSEENTSSSPEGQAPLRGRFTRMLDREFIEDALARKDQALADEAELLAVEEEQRRRSRLTVAGDITTCFHARDRHLQERFPNLEMDAPSGEFSHRFLFPAGESQLRESALEFHCEVSHEGSAFHIHARTTMGGKTIADRLSFPEKKVDMDRVNRFVERKILDFVRTYVG
jgi:hypothetical protein